MAVCVYAICKNEVKHVDRWLSKVKSADVICMLDTGSTDGTFEKIKENARTMSNLFYYQKEYEPGTFDFSDARNTCLDFALVNCEDFSASLEHYPDWIFVSLDLDEFLDEDGIPRLRRVAEEHNYDFDTIAISGLTLQKDGSYSSQIVNHKVHRHHFKWIRSIHEIIKDIHGKKEKEWNVAYSDIKYIHEQDLSKPRDYYGALKKAYAKDPNDIKTCIYCAWEAALHDEYNECYDYANHCIGLLVSDEYKDDDWWGDPQYLLQCFIYKSICHSHESFRYYDLKAAVTDLEDGYDAVIVPGKYPDFKNIHYLITEACWKADMKKEAIPHYLKMIEIKDMPYGWIDDSKLYEDNDKQAYIGLMLSYYYTEDYDNALYYAMKLKKLFPDDKLMDTNLEFARIKYVEKYSKQS